MKALCWHGTGDVHLDTVSDSKILEPRIIEMQIGPTNGGGTHFDNGVGTRGCTVPVTAPSPSSTMVLKS